MLTVVKDSLAAAWEELARREPYFAVLSNGGCQQLVGTAKATDAFFETGEDDIAALLAAITSVLGHELRPACTLDFGCGVGRLTLPLARRSLRVVAYDIAPTMLAHARENAERAGLHNVTFINSEDLAQFGLGEFDFICSLLVFQYIPTAVGYSLLRNLMDVLAPGGLAAIQVIFRQPSDSLRRLARLARERSGPADRSLGWPRRARQLPYSHTVGYEKHTLRHVIEAAGGQVLARFPTHGPAVAGGVLIIVKPLSDAKSA